MAARLCQPSYAVHCRRSQPNDEVPSADQSQGLLLFDGPVCDRPQYLRIKPGVAGQLLRINLIALAVAVRDRSQFADVRHDHLMAKFLQLFADPDRMRASLHRNA